MADLGHLQGIFPSASHILEEGKFDVSEFFGLQKRLLPRSKPAELLQRIKKLYDDRLYCDLVFVCGNVDQGFNSVPCHSLVLVSALPALFNLIETAFNLQTENDVSRIYLPEFSHYELKSFVDSVYQAMVTNSDVIISRSLGYTFGLKTNSKSNMIMVPSAMEVFKSTPKASLKKPTEEAKKDIPWHTTLAVKLDITRKNIKREKTPEIDTTSDLNDYNDDMNDSFEMPDILEKPKVGPPKKKTKRTTTEHPSLRLKQIVNQAPAQSVVTNNTDDSINWASQDTLEEICKRQLDHVINEQLNNLSLPFSWSLSEPSLFSSAGEYQKLLETCRDAGTVIHALTGTHFHLTKEVDTSWTDKYSNKMPKLIRMPDTTISALAAVGVRNGINIIQPIAIKNWPAMAIFSNLLEMLLNIAGTSKSKFYLHDRYYKFKKIACKPNRIGRAMQAIKKLPIGDQETLRLETHKQIDDLEAVRPKLHLAHLPLVSVKMQFSHVNDMSTEEILDYAVLHGDNTSDLSIKSFTNLEVRDFSENDWISIFLDLMVSIMEVENPLVLRNQPTTKDLFEPIDQLLFRHQAFDLIGNPDKRYCIPCRTIFPYATAQEMKEFEQHSLEHSVKKEESAGLLSCTGSTKCSKLFQSKEALAEHIYKCHDKSVKGEGSFCDTCGQFHPNVHRLKKHHDAHHRQIKCKTCGELFMGTIGLASHRDRVHSQKLPCPQCHKLLPSKVKLEYHMISHMAPEEKKYCCEKCGKKFGWSHHLTKHEMNVHVRSRPYKCSVPGCNWAFNDLSNRNMHERRVHKKGPPPKR